MIFVTFWTIDLCGQYFDKKNILIFVSCRPKAARYSTGDRIISCDQSINLICCVWKLNSLDFVDNGLRAIFSVWLLHSPLLLKIKAHSSSDEDGIRCVKTYWTHRSHISRWEGTHQLHQVSKSTVASTMVTSIPLASIMKQVIGNADLKAHSTQHSRRFHQKVCEKRKQSRENIQDSGPQVIARKAMTHPDDLVVGPEDGRSFLGINLILPILQQTDKNDKPFHREGDQFLCKSTSTDVSGQI